MVSGEAHYKAILRAARCETRASRAGSKGCLSTVRPPEGYAQRRNDPLGDLAGVRRVLDHGDDGNDRQVSPSKPV